MYFVTHWKLTLILNFSLFIAGSSAEKTTKEFASSTPPEISANARNQNSESDLLSKASEILQLEGNFATRLDQNDFVSESDATKLQTSDQSHPHTNELAFDEHSSDAAKLPHDIQDREKEHHFKLSDDPRSSTSERNVDNESGTFESPSSVKSSPSLQAEEKKKGLRDLDLEEDAEDSSLFSSSTSIRNRRSSERWRSSVSETDERYERAAISRQAHENQLHKPRNRNRDARRRKVRVTEVEELVKEAIASTVSAALRQELEPLHTALRIVKLDTFTEGIVRQLSTLEHIQSKLLTEYGEMREAVSQASRTAQDLAVQIVGLDARVAALAKDSHSAKMSEASSGGGSATNSRGGEAGSCSRTEELKAVLMQASAAFSARLTATERRVKDDLSTLENRLSEAVKRSQVAFDSRLSTISADTSRILNKTCRDVDSAGDEENLVNESQGQSLRFPFGSGLPLGPSYPSQRSFPSPGLSRAHGSKTRIDNLFDQGGTLNESPSTSGPQADRATELLTLLPFPSWGRAEMVNLAVVSRLAAEIATRISKDTLDPPRDCSDIAAQGETESGVYVIHPAVCSARVTLKVWCDLETDGGGWTVLQKRGALDSGRDDFFKDWADYKWGFGELQSDFWIGNEHIHQLTSSGDYELRIDLTDWGDEERWAVYRHFHLSDEASNYTLHIGDYQGTAGNSLKYHHGAPFSTRDRDNDVNPLSHCARTFHGAWWFTACHESHLNGRYHRSPHRAYGDGINWMTFRGLNYSHKTSRMMVRPSSFSESHGATPAASKPGNTEGRSAPPTPPAV